MPTKFGRFGGNINFHNRQSFSRNSVRLERAGPTASDWMPGIANTLGYGEEMRSAYEGFDTLFFDTAPEIGAVIGSLAGLNPLDKNASLATIEIHQAETLARIAQQIPEGEHRVVVLRSDSTLDNSVQVFPHLDDAWRANPDIGLKPEISVNILTRDSAPAPRFSVGSGLQLPPGYDASYFDKPSNSNDSPGLCFFDSPWSRPPSEENLDRGWDDDDEDEEDALSPPVPFWSGGKRRQSDR